MTQQHATQEAPLNLLQFRGAQRPSLHAWMESAATGAAWTAGGWVLLAAWRHPRLRWLVLAGVAGGLCVSLVRRARSRDADAHVDEMLEASFPASDAPAAPSVPQA